VSKPQSIARIDNRLNLIESRLIETKYIDDLVSATFGNTGLANTLNLVAQGDAVTNRNGNKIFLSKLELRYVITNNTALVGPVNCRVMVIHDRMPMGQSNSLCIANTQTILGVNGVLDSTINATNPHLLPRALEMVDRYKILHDMVHTLNPYSVDAFTITGNTSATATMTGTNVVDRSFFVDMGRKLGFVQVFQDGTANIASVLEGSIVLLAFCDQSANLPTITAISRIYFKDA